MLLLRELNSQDEHAFFEGFADWSPEDRSWYTFTWKEDMSFDELLEILRKERLGLDLAPGRVPHTMLYGFVDGKIVGRVNVRHDLNDQLRRFGGHMGYSVAERHRGRGYATEMVKQALLYCKTLGLDSIMMTCNDDNTPSWKIIENFGGRLAEKFWDDSEKRTTRRYWLELTTRSR